MNEKTKWISNKVRQGWVFLAAGVLVAVIGISAELRYGHLVFNFRLLTGLGILLAGVGMGSLIRYRVALKDPETARRLSVEKQDERSLLIRARAGNRAYWFSAGLTYAVLMWSSFATNGSLPAPSGNALWWVLAACVVVPFGVYLAGVLVDEKRL